MSDLILMIILIGLLMVVSIVPPASNLGEDNDDYVIQDSNLGDDNDYY